MYNEKQTYETAAKRRKTDFLITSAIFLLFIIAAGVAIFFVRRNPIGIAVGCVCTVWLIYSFIKSMKKLPPVKVIFSKEFFGKITAIDYTVPKSARSVKKAVITVSADDKITKLAGISTEAASAYNIGDRVLVVAGTQYPIILERESKIIPCPICGKVRPYTDKKCKSCGN